VSLREELRLAPDVLRRRCDPAQLGFATTAEVPAADASVGQQRALRSIDFAVEVPQRGYNIFATGPDGTGKLDTVEARLRVHAERRPAPRDVVFLFNFQEPSRPQCATLTPGRGRRLARGMSSFVQQAGREIPRAFESESYQHRRAAIVEPLEREREKLLGDVRTFARSRGLDLEVTPAGIVSIPLVHGQPVTPQEFQQLPDQTKRELDNAGHEVEQRMTEVIPKLRDIDGQLRERLHALDREVVLFAVGHLIDDVRREHADDPVITEWLERVGEDVSDNYAGFLAGAEQAQVLPAMRALLARGADAFRARYEVNLFVAGEETSAPVVVEHNPTFNRLFGRIEFETSLGATVTDHRHIRAGAIHKAGGGYLVLRASDVLRQPFAWERLKEILRSGSAKIENVSEQFTLFPTVTLTPDPVPVDVKVVLIGSGDLYELMHALDEDLPALFRVKAEFDVQLTWGEQEPASYAAFVSAEVAREGLLHFDAGAVARIVEDGARRAANQGKLSTRLLEMSDLLTEASHWAATAGAGTVSAEHVQRAISERRSRSDLLEEHRSEAMREGTLHIDVRGNAVGQLNGLAVVALGGYSFGHPTRITATTATGAGELVSIDRESKLTGRIHDKGFLTLRGFLEQRYEGDVPLCLRASLTFEQSYGGVEGDSASSSELYALLSSLAGAPIPQGIAVTGSVDQYGRVQAVGGVTEKIEGFFAACRADGLTGEQGVIIPAANRRHLMLEEEVVAAIRDRSFSVWAVESIDQGLELLTGIPAGERAADGTYPPECINRRVQDRLLNMARSAREWSHSQNGDPADAESGSR
jgi:lon-related putative ATP-dependent protease